MIADWQTLPLTNPIAIFLLVLLVILGAPFLNKLKIPHIVGLILAGVLLGLSVCMYWKTTKVSNCSAKWASFILCFCGLEIDLNTLKKNSTKGIIFRLTLFLFLWCWVRLRVSICFILIGLHRFCLPACTLRIR